MRILWRALPDLALPLALGLALAYLGSGFVPRPAPVLRPPEDLRARGLGYAEESPVRAILERNVLALESTVFDPQGVPPRSEQAPAPAQPAAPVPASAPVPSIPPIPSIPPMQRAAPLDPALKGPGAVSASAPLSGGPAVQGPVASASSSASGGDLAPAQPQIPAQALPEKSQRAAPAAQAAQPAQPAPGQHAQQAQPPQQVQQPAPPLTGIRLLGVIAGGGKPLAMLSVDGQVLSLEPGGAVRGWTLQSVEPGGVVLKSGEHVRRVALDSAPAPAVQGIKGGGPGGGK